VLAQWGPGIIEISTSVPPPPIAPASTSIALFVGWSPSGPTGQALPVTSFLEYEKQFGGLDSRSLLGYAVSHFFDNGGLQARVLRLVDAGGAPVAPTDAAFVTALTSAFAAGGPVDGIDAFNLICVPGLADPAATVMLQAEAAKRRAFLIADSEEGAQVATVTASLAVKSGANAAYSALYFPWVMARDPLQNDAPRAFPASGFVAGVMARTDTERGVWKAPAGTEARLRGATGLAVDLTDGDNAILNPLGINCLRHFPGAGLVAWGARTLAGADTRPSEWKYVPVRRTAMFIEQSIDEGTKWAVFEPNDEPLWSRIRTSIDSFMHVLFKQGAFQGNKPQDAWLVKCDRTTMTQNDIDNGILNITIGFAPLKPAEFVIIQIAEMAGQNSV
jgi:phage tail sheath protein FI